MSTDGVIKTDADLRVGDKVGEYVIERKLGAGSFGSVYGAIQPLIGKQVAVKILSRKYSADPSVVSRFIAEARAVNQIRHKNIIDIFSFGQLEDGRHYHVMELLEGRTLDALILERGGRVPFAEVIHVLRGLARALDAAHAAGIAHRDLKPANVFIGFDEEGRPFPKLLDFGIAKLLTDDLPKQHSTATGAAVGTPDYMSPEQCQGPNVDHRTDVYSFGVLTFQLMTGHLPFQGPNVIELLMKQMTAPPPKPSEVAPDLNPAIDEPLLQMLAKNPDDRPQSLALAMQSLEEAATNAGYDVPPTSNSGEISGPLPMLASGPRSPVGMEPAFAATIPSAVSNEAIPTSISAGTKLVLAVIGCALVGVASLPFVLDPEPTTPDLQIDAHPPVTAPPTPQVEVANPPANVRLAFSGAPDGAEIIVDGLVIGRAPGPISFLRSDDSVEMTFRAPGYDDATQTITPVENATVAVTMNELEEVTKKAPPRRPAKVQPKRNPTDPESTEVPDW